MKKQIIVAVCLLALIGCTKVATAPPEPSSQMFAAPNATETSLLGTWYLKQQVIFQSKSSVTYSGYSASYYITFRYGQLDASPRYAATNCKNYIGTWIPNTAIVPIPTPSTLYGGITAIYNRSDSIWEKKDSIDRSDFWYYDNTTNSLLIGKAQSTLSIISGVLTVTYIDADETIVSTLHQ